VYRQNHTNHESRLLEESLQMSSLSRCPPGPTVCLFARAGVRRGSYRKLDLRSGLRTRMAPFVPQLRGCPIALASDSILGRPTEACASTLRESSDESRGRLHDTVLEFPCVRRVQCTCRSACSSLRSASNAVRGRWFLFPLRCHDQSAAEDRRVP